jgi:parallel beta-helix repeat protein
VCHGVRVSPGTNLQAAVDAHPNGTIFCLQPGTYYLTSSVALARYDRFIGRPGVIFDGRDRVAQALWGHGGSAGQVHVTVRNIVFQHFSGTAVALGWYANVAHNEMRGNQIGVSVNGYSTLDGNYIHDNYQYGIVGGPASHMLIDNNEIAHNNTSNYCGGVCQGRASGSKIVGSQAGTYGLVWRNNYVHDNIGHGIWSDGNVHNAVYEYNRIENNTEAGIFHEISWDAVIRYNRLTNNAATSAGLSCWHGSQIHINDSTNVEVYSNTIIGSNGANGICAVDVGRTDGVPFSQAVANMYVHDNTISMNGSASTGLVSGAERLSPGNTANNRFAKNSYFVSDPSGGFWQWLTSATQLSWTSWRAVAQDTTGSVSRW